MPVVPRPPELRHTLTWRALYASGAFAQRELQVASTFRSRAEERELRLGIGDKKLEDLDEQGAIRPVAFALGGYCSGTTVPAEVVENMVFRDETGFARWSTYEYDVHGHPDVSAMYSPWQMLYVEDVLRASGIEVPTWMLTGDARARAKGAEQLRGWAQMQQHLWRTLDDAWRPVVQLLVRLQNRYMPAITNRTVLLFDPETKSRFDPFREELRAFDAPQVLAQMRVELREVLAVYHFLVERGLDRDPRDGLTELRRARPRAFHIRSRGLPRRAQDCFDAAEILRRFLFDATGEQPGPPDALPMDGRQPERMMLYERGPAAAWSGDEVVAAVQRAELYPHGVHIVHEGAYDRLAIELVVGGLMGEAALDEVRFTDLAGAGGAGVIVDLVRSLDGYARRTLVVLDSEAQARDRARELVDEGALPREDVLLYDTSFEEENSSPQELVELAHGIASGAGVEFSLSAEDLVDFHEAAKQRARGRGREAPSLSTSLDRVVSHATSGQWHLRKRELVEALALRMRDELGLPEGERRQRPLPPFVLSRLAPVLNRPRPVGPA